MGITGFYWRRGSGLRQLGDPIFPLSGGDAGKKQSGTRNAKLKAKTKGKAKQRPRPTELREIYLKAVIFTEVTGAPLPNTPKKIRKELDQEIRAAGDVMAWARQQAGYDERKRARERKRPRRKGRANATARKNTT